MQSKLEFLKQYPLSNFQIEKIFNGNHKMLSYHELYQYDTLKHLFHVNNGSVIIMYHQTDTYGHYCCINKLTEKNKFRRKKELVEFFDLYGLFPDKQLKLASYKNNVMNSQISLAQGHTYLSYLMYNSPYKLSFNQHRFQGPNTQTCGFHCANRILFKELLLPEYKRWIESNRKKLEMLLKSKSTYDDVVVVNLFDRIN